MDGEIESKREKKEEVESNYKGQKLLPGTLERDAKKRKKKKQDQDRNTKGEE